MAPFFTSCGEDFELQTSSFIAKSQVSTHVALDHQTYSALDQHTQITCKAQLTCDEHSRVCGYVEVGLALQDFPTYMYE